MQEQTKDPREEIIISKDVGVYFDNQSYKDDIKSRVFSMFEKKEKRRKKKSGH